MSGITPDHVCGTGSARCAVCGRETSDSHALPKLELWALVTDGKIIDTYEHEDVAFEEAGLHGAANPGDMFVVVHLASEPLARELLALPAAAEITQRFEQFSTKLVTAENALAAEKAEHLKTCKRFHEQLRHAAKRIANARKALRPIRLGTGRSGEAYRALDWRNR